MLDLDSRRVSAWGMGSRLTQEVATAALTMAMEHRRPAHSVVHHTDRGSRYAATTYRELLAEHGLTALSRRGNCWDNAVGERFVHTLNTEHVHHQRDRTREEARQDMFEWMKYFLPESAGTRLSAVVPPPSSKPWRRTLHPVSMKSREDQDVL